MAGLNIHDLAEFDIESGLIRFAGQRAILVDATAMGSLRKNLIDFFGVAVARGILTRFGYMQGWRLADAIKATLKWDAERDSINPEWRIPMVQGIFTVLETSPDPLSAQGCVILDSFEAEQHLVHLGQSDIPVCWTICGLFSGYLSRMSGTDVFVLEEKCVGRGDAACHLLARTREEWGDERSAELQFYHLENLEGWLDSSLHQSTKALKEVERKIAERTHVLKSLVDDIDEPFGMVMRSAAMRRLIDLARRVAKVDSTVLITGESGTGKERIARFVHEQSTRSTGPFIAVSCAAIAETLLESELFGHARGSFTGAINNRPGLFEAANGGTLLLDEIGEVSPGMQVKLLRALQEHEVRRVGENVTRPFNVRVIAATNRELTADIASGRFRMDLYYRLNVVELHMPSLRDRREDILPLARILLQEASSRIRRPITGLSPRAAHQLLLYDWPGNVRELENAMERAVALARVSYTDLEDLPTDIQNAPPIPGTLGDVKQLEQVEREYILAVLALNAGNQTHTAEQLGIGTATLYRKLKKYQAFGAPPVDAKTDD